MQAIKSFFLMALMSVNVNAKTTVPVKNIFSLSVHKKYTKETTELYRSGTELACKTELIPYFVVNTEREKMILSQLEKIKSESNKNNKIKNCSKSEFLILLHDRKTYPLCLSNLESKSLLKILDKECGRNI